MITSNNKYIISGGADKTVRIWNLKYKTLEASLEGHNHSVNSIALTRNNKYIVSCETNKIARIWKIPRQEI